MEAVNALSKPAIEKIKQIAHFVDEVLPKIASKQDRRRIYNEASAVIEAARAFAATPMPRRTVMRKRRIIERLIDDFVANHMSR